MLEGMYRSRATKKLLMELPGIAPLWPIGVAIPLLARISRLTEPARPPLWRWRSLEDCGRSQCFKLGCCVEASCVYMQTAMLSDTRLL